MTDIKERLREECAYLNRYNRTSPEKTCALLVEAADHIAALEAALAEADAAATERAAKLTDDLLGQRKHPGERTVLAIASRAIRRGRHLTATEQLANLKKAFDEADEETRAIREAAR